MHRGGAPFPGSPPAQWQPQLGGLFVRSRNATRLIEPLRKRLQREMPGNSYVVVARLGDLVDAEMRSWIVGATLFTVFGMLALVLAGLVLIAVVNDAAALFRLVPLPEPPEELARLQSGNYTPLPAPAGSEPSASNPDVGPVRAARRARGSGM